MHSDRMSTLGWLESDLMDACADYVARGRSFASLSFEQLSEAWIRALRKVVSDVTYSPSRLVQGDLTSEFYLRKQEPPYGVVADELKQLLAETNRLLLEIGATNPRGLEDIVLHLEEQRRIFRDSGKDGH